MDISPLGVIAIILTFIAAYLSFSLLLKK